MSTVQEILAVYFPISVFVFLNVVKFFYATLWKHVYFHDHFMGFINCKSFA